MRKASIAIAMLLVTCLVVYGPSAIHLGLFKDDWRNLADLIAHGEVSQRTARPLNLAVLKLGWYIFGPNLDAYAVMAVILLFISAFVFWLLLDTLLPGQTQRLALPVAILYLVYPSNYARILFTLWPTGLLVSIVVGGALAYVLYLRTNRLIYCLIALLLLGSSLLWYELQLALIAVLPILSVFRLRQSSWLRRFCLVSPTLLAVAFTALWLLASTSNMEYPTSNLAFSLSGITARVARSYWSMLIVAWVEPIRFLGPIVLSRWQAAFVFVFVLLMAIAGALLLLRLHATTHVVREQAIELGNQATNLRTPIYTVGAFIAIGLGVLPALPLTEIGVSIFDSRFTLFSTLGASAFVVLLAYLLAGSLARNLDNRILLSSVVSGVLIVLAIVYQIGAQRSLSASWQSQRCVWYSMMAQVPSLATGTHVHIVDVQTVPGIWGMSPFHFLVPDMDSALKLLYDEPSLEGTFVHVGGKALPEGREYRFTQYGVFDVGSDVTIPYDRMVVFRYMPDDSLKLLTAVPELVTGTSEPLASSAQRILSENATSPLRGLIEPQPRCKWATVQP